jgi:hypothetical protein
MAGSGGNAVVATSADKTEAIVALGNRMTDTYATDAEIATADAAAVAAHAALAATTGVHGLPKVTLAAGTAAAANVTVTGMVAADTLISVLSFTTAASIASVADRTSEYVTGSGVLTKAAGTNETNNQLVIFWLDKA